MSKIKIFAIFHLAIIYQTALVIDGVEGRNYPSQPMSSLNTHGLVNVEPFLNDTEKEGIILPETSYKQNINKGAKKTPAAEDAEENLGDQTHQPAGNSKGQSRSVSKHNLTKRSPIKFAVGANEPAASTKQLHGSASPVTKQELKLVYPTDELDGKVVPRSLADRIKLFEGKFQENQPRHRPRPRPRRRKPDDLTSLKPREEESHTSVGNLLGRLLARLIPLITEHSITRYHTEPEYLPFSKFRKEEEKLAKSFTEYSTKNLPFPRRFLLDGRLRKNSHTPKQLIKAKWSMVVLKFFLRAFYRLKRSVEAIQSQRLDETEAAFHLKTLEKSTMKDFEELVMHTAATFLDWQRLNTTDPTNFPQVDLPDFAALEPHPYLQQVPEECQHKQADLKRLDHKRQNMCSMAKLMALALSDIVVGQHSILVCLFNEGNDGWLNDTSNKLLKVYTEQVVHAQRINKSKEISQETLLELVNCDWAFNFLHQLNEKYNYLKQQWHTEGNEHTQVDGLYKEMLALKDSIEQYHNNSKKHSGPQKKILKKESDFKEVNLDEFFLS